ncbi:MAG: hypothetical protein LBV68_01015 [Spirochaetaceae bacterium]|nr:hypothetical protein [Spirochaetaceae bacterium]
MTALRGGSVPLSAVHGPHFCLTKICGLGERVLSRRELVMVKPQPGNAAQYALSLDISVSFCNILIA